MPINTESINEIQVNLAIREKSFSSFLRAWVQARICGSCGMCVGYNTNIHRRGEVKFIDPFVSGAQQHNAAVSPNLWKFLRKKNNNWERDNNWERGHVGLRTKCPHGRSDPIRNGKHDANNRNAVKQGRNETEDYWYITTLLNPFDWEETGGTEGTYFDNPIYVRWQRPQFDDGSCPLLGSTARGKWIKKRLELARRLTGLWRYSAMLSPFSQAEIRMPISG